VVAAKAGWATILPYHSVAQPANLFGTRFPTGVNDEQAN
jgi:hypothetical protein